jgi:hypothetical protein
MGCYVHHVPGRLRVESPTLKVMSAEAQDILDFFSHLDGIRRVRVNPVTGSVVIHYDPDLVESGEILQALKENGHFDESRALVSQAYQDQAISRTAQTVGKVLFGWAVGKALENSGLSFLTVLI